MNVVISTRGAYASVYVDGECKLFHVPEAQAEDFYAAQVAART